METGVVLFFIILFVPGLWLVFSFRRDIKQRLWFEEQRRIEHERARETRTSARRRSSRRSAPVDDARLPVEIVPPAPAHRGAEPTEKATATDGSSGQMESGQDLTVSTMGAAFEVFLHETTSPSEDVTPSQVDEAFEKFRG